MDIIELALYFVQPAALIFFFVNLVRYRAAQKNQENAKKITWLIPLAIMAAIFILCSACIVYDWVTGDSHYANFLSFAVDMFFVMGLYSLMLLPAYSVITYFILSLRAFIKASKAKDRKAIHIVNLTVSSCIIAVTVIRYITVRMFLM